MKELARLKIWDADKRILEVPRDEVYEKIDLIYSLGYVYNPYLKEFKNPFIESGLKAIAVYNLTIEGIKKLHHHLEEEYLTEKKRYRSLEAIEKSIYSDNTSSLFKLYLQMYSGIVGIILLLLAIIFHVLYNIEVANILLILSFILVNYFVVYNLLLSQNEDEVSPFWHSFNFISLMLNFALYPYLYLLLFLIIESYWIPIVLIVSMRYLIIKYATRSLAKSYWQFTGMYYFQEYSKENELA